MSATVIYESPGQKENMSRVRIDEETVELCFNTSRPVPPTCDRSAQGISLSTPILMMTFGVVGNVLALIVLYSSRREAHSRRTVFFVMLSGLAWTDLIGQLAVSPIAIIAYANDLQWVGGTELCRYHGFMMVSFGLVMPLIVCCMSVERLLAIKFSYYYAKHITRRKAQCTFLACWCVTAVFSSLPFLGFGSYELQFPKTWCFLNFHRESQIDSVYAALFGSFNIMAILTMILCNLIVAGTLFSMRRSRQLNNSPTVDRRLSTSAAGSTMSGTVFRARRHSDMEAQMIWFLCLITVAFSVCWLPLNVHILFMQFSGTTNKILDLKVIRMASCNQILDPWLYVIFRKNSLLRIIRRLKICIRAIQQVPRQDAITVPKMRYVISNKSYTYEASSLGKIMAPGQCCPNVIAAGQCCPNVLTAGQCCPNDATIKPQTVQEDCEQSRKNECSYGSSDSAAHLMSVCSYCDCDCKGQSASNLMADRVSDRSAHVSEKKAVDCDLNNITSGCCNCEYADRQREHSNFEKRLRGLSEPFIDQKSRSKKTLRTLLTGMDICVSSDSSGAYYSLDSTHHSSLNPKNNYKTKRVLLSPTIQKLSLKSTKQAVNTVAVYPEVVRPQSLTVMNSPSFLILPSPSSPQRLTASRHEDPEKIAINSSSTGKLNSSPVSIPFLLDNIPESQALKRNSHATNVKRNQSTSSDTRAYCQLQRSPTDTHLYLCKNSDDISCVYSKDDIHLSLRRAEMLTRWPIHHSTQSYNLAVIDLPEEEVACMISVKRLSCPHKTKSTFASKLLSFATTNQSNRSSTPKAGTKTSTSSSLLPCIDHSDHIKCFKAKKTTPYTRKNESGTHLAGIQNQTNCCKHSILDMSVGSCP